MFLLEWYLFLCKGCLYFGKATSNEIGVTEVDIERQLCTVEGAPIETSIELNGQVKSQVHVNSATGEKVNHVAAAAKFNITE